MARVNHQAHGFWREPDRNAPFQLHRHTNDTDRRLRIFLLLTVLAVTANVLMVMSGAIQYPMM